MQSTTKNKFWKIEQLHKILFVKKKNTAHAAQRWFCRVNRRQNDSGVLRGGTFFLGNHLLKVVVITVRTDHFLWLCSKWTRPHLVDIFRAIHKNGGIYKKIPLYAEFVKRVLENLLKWRGNSMTYLASVGITNAVLACIPCSENGHRKAWWQQNDNDFCIKNIVHYIDHISLQKQKTAYAAIILSGEPAAK